jgi:hypothetical protein
MDWNQIITNPWVGFAGTLFGIVGVLVSVVIFFRTRRYQQPAYFISSIHWYDGSVVPHNDIKLTFRGKEIPRFTITYLAFWNAGNQTIREEDFVSSSPLRLILPEDSDVFDIRITATTAEEIRAFLGSSESIKAGVKKEIPVHFDYLDSDDGFSVQVIHDSKSATGIKFAGKLPGVSKFRSITSDSKDLRSLSSLGYKLRVLPYVSPIGKWVVSLMHLCIGSMGLLFLYLAFFKGFDWFKVFFGAFLAVYLFVPLFLFSKLSLPKALADAFSENGHEKA